MPESENLFTDPTFLSVIKVVASELARGHGMPFRQAEGFVISGLGEPAVYAAVREAWAAGLRGLAKVILRRRAIDLLRKDARRPKHRSLFTTVDETHLTAATTSAAGLHWSAQVERRLLLQMVLTALDCFASQGEVQRRRAVLLRRYTLEEASYDELSAELGVKQVALRVRVHEAIWAFREHLREHLEHRDRELFNQLPTR